MPNTAPVKVEDPPADVKLQFSGLPLIVRPGDLVQLSWSTEHAQTCEASGAWAGAKASVGSEAATPTTPGVLQYVLTCRGLGAPASKSVDITILDPISEADPSADAQAEFQRLRKLEEGCCNTGAP